MTDSAYQRFIREHTPRKGAGPYTGPLADTSMAFEWPMFDYKEYPYHKGCMTQGVDWDENVNYERMRNYRLERTRDHLKTFNVGAILSIDAWNMRYITGTWTSHWTVPASGLRYCLFPVTAKGAILYEQGEIGFHTRQMCPWLDKVKVCITGAGWNSIVLGPEARKAQTEKLVIQIVDDLKSYNMDKEVLALDFWDLGVVQGLQNAGIKVSPVGVELMLHARKIKNRDEVECLRIAAAIAEAQLYVLKQMIRPGVRENELIGMMHKVAYDLNGEVYLGEWCTSGEFSWPNPRETTANRMIRPNDVIYADAYNTSYMGYKTCLYRTFCCGKASEQLKDDYKQALEWLYDAINIIKPGITTKEIAEKWPPGEKIWGDILVKFEDQTAGSHWGHGIGLSLYEYPVMWREVSLNHPFVLEEGMTFAIETQQGTLGSGGVRIEQMVHVTDRGVEILSKFPIEEITEVW